VRTSVIELLKAQVNDPPPGFAEVEADPRVPEGVEAVILRSIAKSPDDRFQSAEGFVAALAELPEERSVARPSESPPPPGRGGVAAKWPIFVAGLLLGLLVGAGLVLLQ
jgi:hypothetical protein